ncbi:MAG: transposase [Planctomycetaceae bacterium]|nr:transposase [Planctomycetaceae bacterium]
MVDCCMAGYSSASWADRCARNGCITKDTPPPFSRPSTTFSYTPDINDLILKAVRRLRTAMGRRGKAGRKKKRGRKGAKSKSRAARRGLTVKEKAHFVFKHRYLIVKRRENFTASERDDLTRMLEYLPELATLRRFADRIYWLFDTPKDVHQASCRRAAILRDPSFQGVKELVAALEQLAAPKFRKMMAYFKNPISRRVRTNNHVERANRMIRFLEKVRYKWRRRKTLVLKQARFWPCIPSWPLLARVRTTIGGTIFPHVFTN